MWQERYIELKLGDHCGREGIGRCRRCFSDAWGGNLENREERAGIASFGRVEIQPD